MALLGDQPGLDLHAWFRPGTTPLASPVGSGRAEPRWHTVDLLDRASVASGIDVARPDEVYHLAGAAHVGQSWQATTATFDVNVIGTHLLLDALRRAGCPARVLIAGSATIYAASDEPLTEESPIAPASPYALSKLAQELTGSRAVTDDGQAVLLARAFNHVGPGQDASFFAPAFAGQLAAIEAGRTEPIMRVGNLEARRDLTDVRDTVRAYHLLMAHGTPGRPYNICTGIARPVRDVLDALIAQCRLPVRVEVDPARLRPNDMPVVVGSFDRLRQEVGWAPVIPLERTVSDLLQYAREHLT